MAANLLASVPAEIGLLEGCLVELSLWDNALTGLPAEVATLTALEVLNLSANEFECVCVCACAVFGFCAVFGCVCLVPCVSCAVFGRVCHVCRVCRVARIWHHP